MKSKEIIAIVVLSILLLSGIVFVIYNYGSSLVATVTEYKTPIFCNDYEFTCCGGIKGWSSQPLSIWQNSPKQCPSTAIKCRLESFKIDSTHWYIECQQKVLVGSRNCRVEDPWYSVPYFTCDDERLFSVGSEFNPGDYIWVKHVWLGECKGIAYVSSWDYKLGFCGRSGAVGEEVSCGVTVPGSDQCTFHPKNDKIYSLTGALQTNLISYTVPLGQCVLSFQSGDRHICGYMEEQCSVDTDCGGHTYGNQECYARRLQTYGCRDFGKIISEHDRLPDESGWGADASSTIANTFGSRCEVIKTESVQCCGDADCGTNMFCDINTFTCQKEVQCTKDYDCGVSVVCDYSTLKLKSPKCIMGTCGYATESVDCCYDKDCAEGYYCASDYTCDKRITVKKYCPFQCCVNNELYFDRPCPPEETCSENNECVKPIPGKDKFDFNWLLALPILLTIGASVFWGWKQKQKIGSYSPIDFIIGGIFGLLIGIVLRWVFSNWLVLLLIGVVGGGGMIFLVCFLGGLPLVIAILNMFRRK